jgi:lysophospholipase L1-like esterase
MAQVVHQVTRSPRNEPTTHRIPPIMTAMLRVLHVLLAALVASGCGLFDNNDAPTSPSGPRDPNAPVFYTALGASDAVGVGASIACLPLTACEEGTGYVPVIARRLRARTSVTLVNIGIPGAVLSPTIHEIARRFGRDIPANFIEREMPFVPSNSTLVTIFGGGNDANALGDAIERGAAGTDVRGYVDTQVRAFGGDFDRLVRGVRERAPNATIIVLNLPNFAMLPYASGYSTARRQVLQAISIGFSREANEQRANGAVVVDLMCDSRTYEPGRFSNDGFHPNDAGYAALADKVLDVVNGGTSTPPAGCAAMTTFPAL